MELEILKGTRDYLPEDQIARGRVADVIRDSFELFGFGPAETPILNHWEVLASKYAGGAEILKETYRLRDQGDRDLGLRYDLTVPFARMVGAYQGGTLPAVFKRYELGKVFRNGPVKTGRLREFTQCDADVLSPPGADTALIDAEFIAIADRVFGSLGIPAFCSVNDRRLLAELLRSCEVPAERVSDAILSVDKWEKIGRAGVADDLRGRGLDPVIADRFERAAFGPAAQPGSGELATAEGAAELTRLLEAVRALGVSLPVVRTPGLARGLEIYTGTVFEFFWRDPAAPPEAPRPHPQMSSSLAAGGRYDRIVGQFLFPDEPARHASFPAAGMSFGLDVLTTVLGLIRGDAARPRTVTELLIFAFGEAEKPFAVKCAASLRAAGVRTELDVASRKIRHSVEYADKLKIPFHAAVGGNEVARGVMSLKHLPTGEKAELSPEAAAERIRSARGRA